MILYIHFPITLIFKDLDPQYVVTFIFLTLCMYGEKEDPFRL